jgi:hypothetical protein
LRGTGILAAGGRMGLFVTADFGVVFLQLYNLLLFALAQLHGLPAALFVFGFGFGWRLSRLGAGILLGGQQSI